MAQTSRHCPGGRRVDQQFDGFDQGYIVLGLDLEYTQVGKLAPADLAIELAQLALEGQQTIA